MNILFIGDIVGKTGRLCVESFLNEYKKDFDFIIANAENAVSGAGLTFPVYKELISYGIDCLTLGNHTFSKKEILHFIDSDVSLIRPINYPKSVPGKGYILLEKDNKKLLVINAMGRVYMNGLTLNSPFEAIDEVIDLFNEEVNAIFVDFHAEATSEKMTLAYYLDGRVSGVIGTHTHVQTNDERILPYGTAYLTDVGMTGPDQGIIGVDKEIIINKFLKQMPSYNKLADGDNIFSYAIIDIDEETGQAKSIEKGFRIYDDLRRK